MKFFFAILAIALLAIATAQPAAAQTSADARDQKIADILEILAAMRQEQEVLKRRQTALKSDVSALQGQVSGLSSGAGTTPDGVSEDDVKGIIKRKAVVDGGQAHKDLLYAIFSAAGYEGKELDVKVSDYLRLHSARKYSAARTAAVDAGKKIAGGIKQPAAQDVNALAQQIIGTEAFENAVTKIAQSEAEEKVTAVRSSLNQLEAQVKGLDSLVDEKLQKIQQTFSDKKDEKARTSEEIAQKLQKIEELKAQLSDLNEKVKPLLAAQNGDLQEWLTNVDESLKALSAWHKYGKKILELQGESLGFLASALEANDTENGRGKAAIRAAAADAKCKLYAASVAQAEWEGKPIPKESPEDEETPKVGPPESAPIPREKAYQIPTIVTKPRVLVAVDGHLRVRR